MREMEELNNVKDIKSDWLVIENYHERYMFSTDVDIYKDKLLSEVAAAAGYEISDLRYCNIFDNHCMVDTTNRRALEDYEKEYHKVEGVEVVSPSVIIFINLNAFDRNEFCWGQTEHKFGLLDYIKKA